ncbi:GNAT family N-acetyltransferase [Spongiactinospora sp. TRM90649]|uniref:GNAT family N-acetyltransferase n=1 Tax=Spongiactinospora sp. TRM90649 TaxID=3031114 RepID=UPI0023F8D93C|nr:GNAT family N-acetyltransferase [Spongiactinospora sp. TRM90649]MDF5755391.1 GNAT family N-acetyltransferase [Spongiactinospora sp. TRM90649]
MVDAKLPPARAPGSGGVFDLLVDRLVDRAWPAPYRVEAEGWVYRHAGGVSKRANSVLPLGEAGDLGGAVDRAERFYGSLGLPCAFWIGPGVTPGLDRELDTRGYRVVDPMLAMATTLGPSASTPEGVTLEESLTGRWLDAWWRLYAPDATDGGGRDAMAARILSGAEAVYASAAASNGETVAVGRGVVQGEWLGIYCMAVEPRARRAGRARGILSALLSHGGQQGAEGAYLVVTESNTAARALYERAGFAESARRHYRVR